MIDESARAIIEALGLSPHTGVKLIEALDKRYGLTSKAGGTLGALAEAHRDAIPPPPADSAPALTEPIHTIPSPPPSAPSLGQMAEDENFADEVAGKLAELGLEVTRKT